MQMLPPLLQVERKCVSSKGFSLYFITVTCKFSALLHGISIMAGSINVNHILNSYCSSTADACVNEAYCVQAFQWR